MDERSGETLGPVRRATRTFGVWLTEIPNAQKAWLAIAFVASSSFAAGAGATATVSTFSTLPDSVLAIRETQRTQILPRLAAVEDELSLRAAVVGQVDPAVSRVERLESEVARIACLVEAMIEGNANRLDIVRCGRLGGAD